MKYSIVYKGDYDNRRGRILKYIKRAIVYGNLNIDQVEQSIRSGNRLVIEILNPKLCGVLLVEKHGAILHITALSGSFGRDWCKAMLEQLKHYAYSFNCNRIQLKGRPAWKRLLMPLGFHVKHNDYLVYEV